MFSISQPDFLHLCAWTKVILLKKPSGELLGVGWAQRTFIVIRFSATSQLILQIPHKLIQIVVYVCIYIYINIYIYKYSALIRNQVEFHWNSKVLWLVVNCQLCSHPHWLTMEWLIWLVIWYHIFLSFIGYTLHGTTVIYPRQTVKPGKNHGLKSAGCWEGCLGTVPISFLGKVSWT